jgi:hypothetical protein
MSEAAKSNRTLTIYLIIFWIIINVLLLLLLLPEDYMDLNNWIELAL